MRSRDDVNSDDIAHGTRRLRSGLSGGAHGGHVATHERRDEAAADDLPTRHLNLGRLDHGVASLDGGHQTAGFDHSEGIAQGALPYGKEKEAVDADVSGETRARPKLNKMGVAPPMVKAVYP